MVFGNCCWEYSLLSIFLSSQHYDLTIYFLLKLVKINYATPLKTVINTITGIKKGVLKQNEPKMLHWVNVKCKKADIDSNISGWQCYAVTKY